MATNPNYTIWGIWRGLIYNVVGLTSMAACLRLITYPTPEYTTLEKLPAVLVPLAWNVAAYMLYWYRKAWAGKLAWMTRQGVAVYAEADARQWLAPRELKVEEAIAGVVRWWTGYFRQAGHTEAAAKLAAWFNGSNLEVVITAEGLADPRHGIRNKAGLAYPKRMVLQLDPTDMAEGSKFIDTLEHEACHECCFAFGVPDGEQHEFMKQAGCPYA